MKEKKINMPNVDEDVKYIVKGQGDIQISITSLLHGNEFSGLQVNNKIIENIQPKNNIKIISFPIMNPDGFLRNSREHSSYGDLDRNPLSKIKDNESINYIEKIYNKYLRESDLVIDLHSLGDYSSKFTILNRIKEEKVSQEKAKEIRNTMLYTSKNIGFPIIEESHTNRNYLCETLINQSQTPALKIILGGHIIDKEKTINKISNNIINAIKKYSKNKNPQINDKFAENNPYYKKRYIKAPVKGEINKIAKPGEHLKKEDKIFSVKTKQKEIYKKSPSEGWLAAYEPKKRLGRVCMYAKRKKQDNLIY